ncbi:hypothetical protein [Helicobacter sp.]|uniref:ABC-type transport auxiliary lipoprotein family protein n=1 Tax=Helicobacter sp. TaxID=218 RepID=UPI0019836A98|nr:hypothetical protein [Helicobacter sp.]MBD5164840.1 hypothetical protein [Helicobacter sp.]
MQRVNPIFKGFFLLVCLLVFSGCLGKELPKIQHYELSLDTEALARHKAERATMVQKVRNPLSFVYLGTQASLKIASRKIAYKTNENTIEYFARNEWIEPLPLMVDSLVLKMFEPMNLVMTEEIKSGIPTLALKVLDFYYDEQQEAVVLNLLVQKHDSSTIFSVETKVSKGDFYLIIGAMNQAINSALINALASLD